MAVYIDGQLITSDFPIIHKVTEQQFAALPTDGTADGFYDIQGSGGEVIAPTVMSYADWLLLPEEERNNGNYILTGLTPHTNAYSVTYKNNISVGQQLDNMLAGFKLSNQTLTFTNNVATVTDSRITTDTCIFVFYSDSAVAAAANISTAVTAGTVTFTAQTAPSSTLTCTLLCF